MSTNNMGKQSVKDLLKGILSATSKDEKSINEVTKETSSSWKSVEKYLETLKEAGVVEELFEGNKRAFRLIKWRDDTYLGLPIKEKDEKLIKNIFAHIKEQWQKKSQKRITQTQAQKILFEVNQKCKLNLPMSWYIYGAIATIPFSSSFDYILEPLAQNIEDCVSESVSKTVNEMAYQTKNRQYETTKEKTYSAKEIILSILYSNKLGRNSFKDIIKNYDELILLEYERLRYEPEIISIIDAYRELLFDIYSELDTDTILNLRQKITNSFESIWKLIALFRFKDGLKEFHDEETLKRHFLLDITLQKEEVIEIGTELQSLIPVVEPDTEEYKRISELQKKIMDKLKTKKHDFETKDLSQEELFKKIGL